LREMLRTIPTFTFFRVHMCGNIAVSPEWRIEPRVIDDLHPLMVMGGKGLSRVGGGCASLSWPDHLCFERRRV